MANDGTIRIGVNLDEAGFKQSIGNLGSAAKKGMAATVGAIGAASVALAGFGLAGIKVGAEFEAAMSQVGATMGMSAEEIRNGSKEFEMLEKAAMDAGKSTQFSAKQSAEALNYLALAGYDANKSVEALPVVLDLAAAGGLELAYASDLVTDSMSALGLQTSELSGFTDQLAKASQKSNTSVGQLGEAILTVGGTAKNLAGGTVELNTALGIFADNGIKGSEGGTALRNIILSLSAPTDKAAIKMKELGVEVFDAEGNMRPLNETFQDLDKSLIGLTQEDKMNALSTIFNNRDLKSATALLANSGQRFDELSGYIGDAEGAAAQMAVTMNDNLKGSITILKSSLEGLGIEFYKNVDSPAKDVVKTLTGMVGSLTSALESGGLQGLVNKIGGMFADVVVEVSSFAPKMVDAGVSLIQSFIQGLTSNLPTIVEGAIQIVTSLVSGIVVLIPQLATLGYQAILSLMEGISGQLPLLAEQSSGILTSLLSGLSVGIPEILNIGTEILIQLMQGIEDALPGLPEKAILVIKSIVESLAENIGLLVDSGIEMIMVLGKSLIDSIPTLIQEVPKIVIAIADIINTNAPKLLIAALELIIQLGIGLIQAIPTLIANIPKIIEAIIKAFLAFNWINLGKQLMTGLKDGVVAGGRFLIDSFNSIITTVKTNISQLPAQFTQIGGQLITGLWNGIASMKDWIINNIFSFATGITSSIKSFFGIESPSKVMREQVGKPIVQGIGVGIKQNEKYAVDAAKEMSKKTIDASKGVLDTMVKDSADMVKAVDENGKKLYKTQEDIDKKLYQQAKDFINLKKEQNELSAEEELELWKYVGENFKLSAKEQIEVEKNKNKSLEDLAKEREKIEKDNFDNSKKWIDNKKKLNELSLAEEYQAWQRVQAQYAEGTDYRLEADEQAFKAKSAIIEKINKLEDDYTKAVEDRSKQIFNAYSLFEEIKVKEPVNSHEMISNLEQQVVAIKSWSSNIEELSKRAIDEGLLEELRNMGPEANQYIEAFLKMSESQFEEYNKLYKEKRELANEQATKELVPKKEEMQAGIAELVKGIEEEFDKGKDIGSSFMENFANGIKESAPAVLQAFGDAMQGLFNPSDIFSGANDLVKTFTELGENINNGLSIQTLDDGLVPELQQIVPQAQPYIDDLLSLTQDGLTIYTKIFKEQSKLAREQMMAELNQLYNEVKLKTADIIIAVDNEFSKAPEVGLNMALGLAKGIREGMSEVINAAIEVAREAIIAAKEELDINSPSKVFQEIGKNVDEGLAEGINDNLDAVDKAMANMKDSAELDDGFDIKFNGVSDDLYKQGLNAGNKFFEGFSEALKKVQLVVNATMASMTPNFAIGGMGSSQSNIVTNNKNEVIQNFYVPTVTPYGAYRRSVLNGTR